MDIVNKIVDWEDGQMSPEDEISFFQELVSTGMAWELQGMYGRRAMELLKNGDIQG